MTDLLRQEVAAAANTVVVKVGTRVLTRADGTLSYGRIAQLAEELIDIVETGRHVVLVSSGAVGAGMGQLGIKQRPSDVAKLQAIAAVGQTNLIETYDSTLRKHGYHAAQVLLTADDLDDRTRYLNVRNTLLSLIEFGAIPIINENDTVAVYELAATFGDNDRLAAMVTNLIRAPLLIVLSDVDGVYDGDPSLPTSKRLETIARVDETVMSYVIDKQTGLSKGGMASKLEAARIVCSSGENAIIASGREPGALARIMKGEVVGTLVLAEGKSLSPLKRWIGFSAQPRGRLVIDDGARRAIVDQGRSLLAAGITDASGEFVKGDIVSLVSGANKEIARGLTNYPAKEVQKIKGLKSGEIASVLGHQPYQEVIHRDNMMVTSS
jgi:glutamate 5-kinase